MLCRLMKEGTAGRGSVFDELMKVFFVFHLSVLVVGTTPLPLVLCVLELDRESVFEDACSGYVGTRKFLSVVYTLLGKNNGIKRY